MEPTSSCSPTRKYAHSTPAQPGTRGCRRLDRHVAAAACAPRQRHDRRRDTTHGFAQYRPSAAASGASAGARLSSAASIPNCRGRTSRLSGRNARDILFFRPTGIDLLLSVRSMEWWRPRELHRPLCQQKVAPRRTCVHRTIATHGYSVRAVRRNATKLLKRSQQKAAGFRPTHNRSPRTESKQTAEEYCVPLTVFARWGVRCTGSDHTAAQNLQERCC